MLVRESISFQRGVDPKKTLGIGIFHPKSFASTEEAVKYLIEILPDILKKDKIPNDIIQSDRNHRGDIGVWFSWKYYYLILDYMRKYMMDVSYTETCIKLSDKLEKMGYKR
jgi:hypothetical protein